MLEFFRGKKRRRELWIEIVFLDRRCVSAETRFLKLTTLLLNLSFKMLPSFSRRSWFRWLEVSFYKASKHNDFFFTGEAYSYDFVLPFLANRET